MNALVVRQPWADLIATGRKAWEFRRFRPGMQTRSEPLVIIAGAATPLEECPGDCLQDGDGWPKGCAQRIAVAIVRIESVLPARELEPGPWILQRETLRWAWRLRVLADVRAEAIRIRGHRGVFRLSDQECKRLRRWS